MRSLVIINPMAGRRGGDRSLSRADLARQVLGPHIDVQTTERPHHAEELAREAAADGFDVVFAWGGDGTINEVARALAFTDTALALVPAGSGNGLARALGIPLRPAAALARAASRPARRIDAGSFGGRFFVNVAGVGLDAEIARRFARHPRRGTLPYVTLTLRVGIGYKAIRCNVDLGGDRLSEHALLIALANSSQYGVGAVIAPNAVIDDGLLDLVIVRDRPLIARFVTAGRLLTRMLHRTHGVLTRRVTQVAIESNVPLRFHVDGEAVEGGTRLEGTVYPGALKIRA